MAELVSYKTPGSAGDAEFTEKRSVFIARVIPAESEGAAKAEISRIRAKFHDASHNCWCYIIRGGPERYSDDGEPQGTAGLPMLEVFRRGGILNVCCVVTRYFGGILLGPGGLSRAYSEGAKLALDSAGIAEFRLWEGMKITCPYHHFGRVKSEIEGFGGIIRDTEYGETVVIHAMFADGQAEYMNRRLADISAGTVFGRVTGKEYANGIF